jgi:hypothetical protein
MNPKTLAGCVLITVGVGLGLALVARSASRKRSFEERFDEDAVSRMDDEGGSFYPVPAEV